MKVKKMLLFLETLCGLAVVLSLLVIVLGCFALGMSYANQVVGR